MGAFKKMEKALEKKGHSKKSADKIAASAGRKALGSAEMTRRSVAGRKQARKK